MMRHGMMPFGHADPGIRAPVQFARHLECDDPGDVSLKRQQLQIEHELGMVIERIGHTNRRLGDRRRRFAALSLRPLDTLLHIPHSAEILIDRHAVTHTQTALQPGHVRHRQVEDAPVRLEPCRALIGCPPLAEQPFEHRPRVALHRHRRRGILPRVGVLIDTAIPVLAAADDVLVIQRQLQRRQRRVGADHGRGHLVDGCTCLDVGALGLLGSDPTQPSGVDPRVHATALTLGLSPFVAQPAHHDDLVPQRLEWPQHRCHLEPGADGLGVEVRQIRAIGAIDEPETRHAGARGPRRRRQT